MAKNNSSHSKNSSHMSEREKRLLAEQEHEAQLIEDILNEFKNFDENDVSHMDQDDLNTVEPEYGFEMPEYVKALFSGNTVDIDEEPVPTVADFKLDPKIFEPEDDEVLTEMETEPELDIEHEEIDFFSELFVKNFPSIEANNELTSTNNGFEIDEALDEADNTKVITPEVEESAGVDVTEEDYSQENELDLPEDEEFFSTRELRSEFFTAEFDEKFRDMFAGSLDNENKKLGGRKVRSAMVTPEEVAESRKNIEPVYQQTEVYVPKKKKSKGKGLWTFLLVVFIGVFLFAGYQFASTYITQLNESNALGSLADIVTMAKNGNGSVNLNGVEYEATDDNGSGILLQYQQLADMNEDMAGWLNIPGTVINYPVMYTPDDPEYYLHRDFFGEDSSSGVLFVDANCDIESSDNQIIYGHNMKNDTMFGTLDNYADKEFWEENQYIYYDSLYEEHVYQVVCVFESRVLNKGEDGFRYYRFYGSESEEEFNMYVEGIKSLELYDTGIDISYGDKLITLSTCAYFTDEGRFVVVAKQIS